MKKTLVSIIYFKNCNECINFISSIILSSNNDMTIFLSITVNFSDPHIHRLENFLIKNNLRFIFYYPNNNIGYLQGLINGSLHLLDNFKLESNSIDYYIFSNTDITFNGDFLLTLQKNNYPNNVGVIGPSIYSNLTKSLSNPVYVKRTRKLKLLFLRLIFSSPILNVLYFYTSQLKNKTFKKILKQGYYYQVHGAIFLISSKMFNLLKKDDDYPLLFSEESIISEIALNNNLSVYYDTSLKTNHIEHSVVSKEKFNFIFENYSKSLDYVLKKFY
jgi:hypothetical protein